jgi:hypothetical protein
MRITTRAVYSIETGGLLEWEGYEYEGPIGFCKGADSAVTSIGKQQQDFFNTLQKDYGTQFANQSNILQSLQNSLAPTVAAGPNQFGYNTAQTNALNSTAIQGSANANRQAQQQLQNQQAIAGGGNEYLPSGVNAQNNATVASNSANNLSNNLLNIQNAGYQQGNQNYNNALAGMGGVANQYNPSSYAGQITNAGNAAYNDAQSIQKQNDAASPWSSVGGLLGGVAGAFLGPMGAGIGSKLGSSLGGMFGGSGGADSGSGGADTSWM